MCKILVVDDDPLVLRIVASTLEAAGYDVVGTASAKEAKNFIEKDGLPHLVIVDIRMPGVSGLELCRELRRSSDVPMIMLTSVDDRRTVVKAIQEFADDYVTKPFDPQELAARVRRVISRRGDFSYTFPRVTKIDERLAVDFSSPAAIVDGESVHLTPTEAKILEILVANRGRIVTTGHLLRRVWPDGDVLEDTLRVNIHRLRKKTESEPSRPVYLHTEHGVGYAFRQSSNA